MEREDVFLTAKDKLLKWLPAVKKKLPCKLEMVESVGRLQRLLLYPLGCLSPSLLSMSFKTVTLPIITEKYCLLAPLLF